MHEGSTTGLTPEAAERAMREGLARADRTIASAGPVLRHFLLNDDPELVTDEVIARVRGMLRDLARQLLESPSSGSPTVSADESDSLVQRLAGDPAVLAHAHALALEGHLLERLQQRSALDPVLTPLIVELAGSADRTAAELAMQVLAAQARFSQHHRRMELPLHDLPAEVFHAALTQVEHHAADGLRAGYSEAAGRPALLARLALGLPQLVDALLVEHAGLSIFLSALSLASGKPREATTVWLSARNSARMAVALRAAGLPPATIEAQVALLRPEQPLPGGIELVPAENAAAMLSASSFQEAL